jgi:hypothetical protein
VAPPERASSFASNPPFTIAPSTSLSTLKAIYSLGRKLMKDNKDRGELS